MKQVVLIADSSEALRTVRIALRNAAGFRVVASLDGRSPVRRTLRELRPDLVLVDQMCQRTNYLTRIGEVCSELPHATVVALTNAPHAAWRSDALEAGADAALSKRLHPATFAALLTEVSSGNVVSVPWPGSWASHTPVARTSA